MISDQTSVNDRPSSVKYYLCAVGFLLDLLLLSWNILKSASIYWLSGIYGCTHAHFECERPGGRIASSKHLMISTRQG